MKIMLDELKAKPAKSGSSLTGRASVAHAHSVPRSDSSERPEFVKKGTSKSANTAHLGACATVETGVFNGIVPVVLFHSFSLMHVARAAKQQSPRQFL
jgi:hypothetical protein